MAATRAHTRDSARRRVASPTLAMLPRVGDSLPFLYADIVRIVQDDTGVSAETTSEDGDVTRVYLPTASLSCVLLGPGTSITQPALATFARHGTTVICTGSGGVRLDRIKAQRVVAEAGSGGMELTFLAPVADLTAEAGSGGITVRLPETQGADIDIETGSGGIDTDFTISTSRFARRHIRGTIGNGNARIRIEAGSGSVRLLKS